jgi:hypothetical protein
VKANRGQARQPHREEQGMKERVIYHRRDQKLQNEAYFR